METLQLSEEHHPDFIWTWKSSGRGSKVSIWVPYFAEVTKIQRSKNWRLSYNGGNIELDLKKIDFIMFYGATGSIPLAFMDDLSQHQIIMMIHRRNQIHPFVLYPPNLGDDLDVVSRQILYRNNLQKKSYIARTLIRARLNQMRDVIPIPLGISKKLNSAKSVSEIRNIEAQTTARYWDRLYSNAGIDSARRSDHPLSTALNAGSKFIFGVILRWVLFHKLSPTHGYLHEPTSYPSIVYDLMEPYRYIFERAAMMAWETAGKDKKNLIAVTLSILKDELDTVVYVPATRQFVRRKNLLHGVVLALRAYLLGEVPRLVLPLEGVKKGGRPPCVGYRLPGEKDRR